MKTLFVYNPHAGHVQIKPVLWDIVNELSNTYEDLNIYASKKQKDIYRYVKENADKYDLLVVSGGDGSLSESVNALMELENKPKLAYIPAGSTNDYASSLKLPKNMIECAKDIAFPKEEMQVDVGKFNNQYFIYVAAFGLFTSVAYSTPQDIKNVLGHLAYILNGFTSLTSIKNYHLRIESNHKIIEDDFIYGMITNSLSVGGIYQMENKDVQLNDGLFEVLLIKAPKDIADLNEIIAAITHEYVKTPLVYTFKTNKITIECDQELGFTLDGENGGSPKIIEIENIHNALTIIK